MQPFLKPALRALAASLQDLVRFMTSTWRRAAHSYRHIASARWLLLGVVVGVASGSAATLFFTATERLTDLFLTEWSGLLLPQPAGEGLFMDPPGPFRPWLIPALTMAVGLLTGWLVSRFIPDSYHTDTDGTDAMIRAFHQQQGQIRLRNWLIRGPTAILTIASGGSAGREGPISLIGAGLGSWIANRLKLTPKERRILLLAGAAGGLGAIFRAPLGGALTAIEVIYREDFETEAILPAVISSVTSYSLFTFFFGTEPMFGIPHFAFQNALELPFYVLLGLACAVTGRLYVRSFLFIKERVAARLKARIGILWTTALGGLAVGVLGMVFPQVLSGGYGWLELAMTGGLSVAAMVAIATGKTLATAVTIGSGMSGGMFAPALFVGGMTGGAVGYAAHALYPGVVTEPGGYVLVGMAAFFAGVAKAPVGPLVMVCELTQGYGLLAPLMLSTAVSIVGARGVRLYEHQVDSKFDSPAHLHDSTINILEQLRVRDYYAPGKPTSLHESDTLGDLVSHIADSTDFYFPVLDEEGRLCGILDVADARQVLFDESLDNLVRVKDLARPPAFLRPEDDLYSALLRFVDTQLGRLPVLDEQGAILGDLNREDVFKAYQQAMKASRED